MQVCFIVAKICYHTSSSSKIAGLRCRTFDNFVRSVPQVSFLCNWKVLKNLNFVACLEIRIKPLKKSEYHNIMSVTKLHLVGQLRSVATEKRLGILSPTECQFQLISKVKTIPYLKVYCTNYTQSDWNPTSD